VDEKSGKSISKELKRKLACGGTFKNGKIELQGNHKERVKQLMVSLGFDENLIEVS
jgi:translation initiation factor 1